MANVPCQLVIVSEDPINLPIKDAFVIVKQLFMYGVKDVSLKGDRIFVHLTYSPNNKTLKKKFGYLPLRYMRVKVENDKEFQVLENICKKYRFNLLDDEVEEFEKYQQQRQLVGTKRPYLPPPPPHFGHSSKYSNPTSPPATSNDDDDDDPQPSPTKKRKVTTKTTTTQNQDIVDLEELNMEDFLSQK
ncbi:uncharacterized protein [Diabrotica undecimpunctata]|uniref:uncharacterized protein n=1 Tax=Diabrotica undecimpunctata TaxID=50387 RepID=UPI003B6389E2